ncbi:MAG TPA: hypothetical protein VFR82_14590, partial [Nitrospira sp.]|nr:hypothetical protein [Nitrospira sp.]
MNLTFTTLGLVLIAAFLASSAAGSTQDQFLPDCATETYAPENQPTKIRFIVWCGVRSDDVSFSLQRPKDERIVDYGKMLQAWGPGAVAPF